MPPESATQRSQRRHVNRPSSSNRSPSGSKAAKVSTNGSGATRAGAAGSATGSAGAIIRDAKGLASELKAMLSRKDPWDREVEFQREALRKVYLRYIFFKSHPTGPYNSTAASAVPLEEPQQAPAAAVSTMQSSRLLDVLTLLWLETSHAIIHAYRAKISNLEKAMAENPKAHKAGSANGNGNNGGRHTPVPGPTARRKLIHSFRSFLAEEEEFWRSLLSRLANSLAPSDWVGLRSLGVIIDDRVYGDDADTISKAALEEVADPLRRPTNVDRIQQSGSVFDPQAVGRLNEDERRAKRNSTLPLAHKALICYGDLVRYSELYNEPSNNAALLAATTGKKDFKKGSGSGGPGGKGTKADGERKAKNWAKAAECYHQARLLLPDNGNPSNQLAVLAQYASDTLSSAYHYYRALSVRSPFPTARKNLEMTYAKSVARWFAEDSTATKDEGAMFRSAFVALNGLYFINTRSEEIPKLSGQVEQLFRVCISQRLLPSEIIVKVAVTALCALWNARMFRTGGIKLRERSSSSQTASAPDMEPHLLLHVLSLYRILLITGAFETNELLSSNVSSGGEVNSNLALNISAVFRRILPAIRILSKWIMGQMEYIARVRARVSAQQKTCSTIKAVGESKEGAAEAIAACNASVDREQLDEVLSSFWTAYVGFANAIRAGFPLDRLPSALDGGVWLEEDVDMLGFAPLRRGMKEGVATADGKPLETARVGQDVHPNEEQLMRIANIQSDAILITNTKASPISLVEDRLTVTTAVEENTPESVEATDAIAAAQTIARAFGMHDSTMLQAQIEGLSLSETLEDEYDDEEFYPNEPEDDPVDLAMRISEVHQMDMDIYADGHDLEAYEDDLQAPSGPSYFKPINTTNAVGSQIAPTPQSAPMLGNNSSNRGHHSPVMTAVGTRSIWAPMHSDTPTLPSAAEIFESLPNTTHSHTGLTHPKPTATNVWGPPRPTTATPPTAGSVSQPASALASSLFGNFSPFPSPQRPVSSIVPSNTIPASFAEAHSQHQQLQQQGSDLSPLASPFNRSPQGLPGQLQDLTTAAAHLSHYPYGGTFG